MSSPPPKLFVSYSWTTPDHEAWVLQLATDLRDNGVDVVFDKWDLREGHDAYAFMEKMVADKDITKVILLCNRTYAEKADGRSGGVGTETQIISPKVYAKEDQDKFVAVVTERDDKGNAFLPTYYKSRIYIDLSDASRFAENFEQLLRWVYDKPLHVKPDLGKAPQFLVSEGTISLGTTAKARRAADAVRSGRDYWHGAVAEYFTTFTENLERFRMPKEDGERDDQLVENIESFVPYRNEAIDLFFALAQYQPNDQCTQLLHRFFEGLLPYLERPEHVNSWNECDFDNFRFIIHELYLYAIAILLKYERFDAVGAMLRTHFYLPTRERGDSNGMVSFGYLRQNIRLLDHRNQRLELRRTSLQADLLEKRSHDSGVQFRQIMQADFLLFIRDSLDRLANDNGWQVWWPLTLVYIERQHFAFELFARSQSKAYFSRLCPVFDISTKEQIGALLQAFNEQKVRAPSWDFTRVNPGPLMAFETMASRP
ncbi:MAG: TIR domain-containing protein [Planctomycetes bacterium]|nr:TIR domain-containing protein [Planctomycetota bacterium]